MLNKVILVGRLTRDPDLRYIANGTPVGNFTLAVNRPFLNGKGEREADFIPIVAWRKLGEQASQHLSKGRLVAVDGRLQIREYQTQDGQRRWQAEVVADGIRFLDGKRNGNAAAETTAEAQPVETEMPEAETDDVPF
jgi:single-strand DNA-binding protein